MKLCNLKRLLFSLFVLSVSSTVMAQEMQPNLKFGSPTKEEIAMKEYPADKKAPAVVLYHNVKHFYSLRKGYWQLYTDVDCKIKILTSEGKDETNVSIGYYESKNESSIKEKVVGLKAVSYNIEDGKVVKTKMKSSEIFTERIDDNHVTTKFSVPNVKPGSVIEYSYRKESDFYSLIDTWVAQQKIPVLYSRVQLSIPDRFVFQFNQSGAHQLEASKMVSNVYIDLPSETASLSGTDYEWVARNLPGVDADNYIYDVTDFLDKVEFELSAIYVPGYVCENLSSTWDAVIKNLKEADSFGKRLKISNPLKEELAKLNIDKIVNVDDKVATIFHLLKSKVKWDKQYRLGGDNASKILKRGTGSNADINFILIAMLKAAGLKAYPVLMSSRDNGRMAFFPSLRGLNTFIVAVDKGNDKYLYLDGSSEDGSLYALPSNLLVDRCILVRDDTFDWVDVQHAMKGLEQIFIESEIDEKGIVRGHFQSVMKDESAADFRHDFREVKDSITFVDSMAKADGLRITNYKMNDMNVERISTHEFDFVKAYDATEDRIYVNPMIVGFLHENPFKKETRELPVEFAHLNTIVQTVSIKLPEGYVVEELPKGVMTYTVDKGLEFVFMVNQNSEGVLQMQYRFNVKRLLFGVDEYEYVKHIFESVVKRLDDVVVLKKV